MIRIATLFLWLAGPAVAETARVISGEHADFTRLVVELPQADGWTVGRTPIGYGFAVQDTDQPEYDLSAVWQRIPRTRLQALRVDPETGTLELSLACPCHVFPFEYQPGMVVLDIREGEAPAGSVFEMALMIDRTDQADPGPVPPQPLGGYDWLDADGPDQMPNGAADLALGYDVGGPDLGPLRDALLRQISRGAVDGVVDMDLPNKISLPDDDTAQDLDRARISLGELPGLVILDGRATPEDRPDADLTCLPDAVFSLAEWGEGRPPLDLLAEARAGLFGEFDLLQEEEALRSVRLHLYLGFGAEALQYADLVPTPVPDELAVLKSLARLIDGEPDPATPFARMTGCDGAVAMWAALAHDQLPTAEPANTDAMVRAFQALPPHLRLHLGERLADLVRDRDPDAARMIRDAMERTPDVSPGTVALLDAKADLQADRPEEALAHAEAAIAEGDAGLDSLIALVEAHFQSSTPLSPDIAETLLSMAEEAEGGPERPEVNRALALALALSGQSGDALAIAGEASDDVWRVLSKRATDGDLLLHAVLPDEVAVPVTDEDVSAAIAQRLSDLGFAEAALAWLGPVGLSDSEERRLLAARAELASGDARQALTLVTGLTSEEAALLRAEAQAGLGAYDAAKSGLQAAGRTDDAARLAAWEADWAELGAIGSEPWAAAAAYASPVPVPEAGALARGASALDSSSATREAIAALLATVPAANP
ncbi:MAG: hypothetical protein MUE52_03180 [Tabrizicola sp.]|jgi:hypothetical protein|nr:hypothetical protein [Tabrizicola sp.]